MEKRKLFTYLLFLPLSLFATTKTPFLLTPSHKRHRIKERWMNMHKNFHYFDYDDREEMGYGMLRVLDDFKIEKLTGTPIHPHKNMEILTIMLEGRLFHQDTLGNSGVLQAGEVQLMSAGSGLKHAETNPSQFDAALGLQIWLSPKVRDSTPYYQQKKVPKELMQDRLYPLVSTSGEEGSLIINLDALIYRGQFSKKQNITLSNRFKHNGFYIFVIKGSVELLDHTLTARDSVGINQNSPLSLTCHKGCDLLVFDIPMDGLF